MNELFIKKTFQIRKMIIIYISLFFVINLTLLGLGISKYYITDQITNIKNQVANRKICLSTSKNFNKEKYKEIKSLYYNFDPFYTQINNKYDAKLKPAIVEEIPRIIYGKMINNKKAELVIPDYFVTSSGKIPTKQLLNKEVNIPKSFQNENQEQTHFLKVVGIYSSQGFNDVYISQSITGNDSNEYVAIAKKGVNVESLIKKISTKDKHANFCSDSSQSEIKIYNNIDNYINIIFTVFMLIDAIIILLVVSDLIRQITKDIAILKVFGYSTCKILINLLFGLLLVIITPLLILSTLISFLMIILRLATFKEIIALIVSIIILNILLLLISNIIFYFKVTKISIIQLIKNGEN